MIYIYIYINILISQIILKQQDIHAKSVFLIDSYKSVVKKCLIVFKYFRIFNNSYIMPYNGIQGIQCKQQFNSFANCFYIQSLKWKSKEGVILMDF